MIFGFIKNTLYKNRFSNAGDAVVEFSLAKPALLKKLEIKVRMGEGGE